MCARRVGERPVGRGTEGTASSCEAASAPGRAFFRLPFFARAKKGNPGCRGGATRN